MKKKILLTVLIIIVIMFANIAMTFATTRTELNNRQNEINQQLNQSRDELGQIRTELNTTMQRIENLNAQIAGYESQIGDLNAEITSLEGEIAEATGRLQEAEANFSRQEEMFQNRLVALYMSGGTTFLDVLLSSDGVLDFMSNYFLLSEIAAVDTELLNQMERNRNEIDAARRLLEDSKANVEAARATVQSTTNALRSSQSVQQQYATRLTDNQRRTQAEIDELNRQAAAVEAEIRALAARPNPGGSTQFVGGTFAWPVPGFYWISSPFGNRPNPFGGGSTEFHRGIDIAGSGINGRNVVAANDGIVTTARSLTGFGNTVMIDHGGGVTTLYAHGSRILVSQGQRVTRGQPIMLVGSTGWSTGPHLHFEVRQNGTAVNPMPWFQ